MRHPPRATSDHIRALGPVLRRNAGVLIAVGIFSLFVNALILTGPLYMLNVYDRVLGSRSVPTLVALTAIAIFLYGCMVLLDMARGQLMARVAARFQRAIDPVAFDAQVTGGGSSAIQDLDDISRMIASPAALAIFDLPWTPLFFLGIFIFHPDLGWVATLGAGGLVALTLINRGAGRSALGRATAAARSCARQAAAFTRGSDTLAALDMTQAANLRWQSDRFSALTAVLTSADVNAAFASLAKGFRMMLQSGLLGFGAFLVLKGQLSSGAMIAASILMGRGLAPIEALIGNWATIQRGTEGWRRLDKTLASPRATVARRIEGTGVHLCVEGLVARAPAHHVPVLKGINFAATSGQAIGVIGPSGSGKSTLAKALVGTWPNTLGRISIEVAAQRGAIGYLPQSVALFDGTIAENIARLSPSPDTGKVVAAAKLAGAHEMILAQPDGYDTMLDGTSELSGGQAQRVCLARAIFDAPSVLVLDEPNSSMDHEGTMALNRVVRSVKQAGGIVIVMTHRPAAIQECDLLLVLDDGQQRAFGPKAEVLANVVENRADIRAGAA